MFENLLQLVKDNAGDAIINNPAIPNEHNDAAIETASGSIMDGLKQQFASGGLDSITQLFNQGGQVGNNPAVQSISQNAISGLMQKFGIDNSAASGIVSQLVPTVMEKLVHKTNDPNDSSFDIGGIVKSLGGSDIGSMVSNFFK